MDRVYHFPFQKRHVCRNESASRGGTSDKWSFATLFG